MQAQENLRKNYIYNLCYQILLVLTPIITTPYVSRVLGADGVGTVSYAESVASYFVLFATFGVTTYGQREIAYCRDGESQRSRVFWETKILQFTTSGIALALYAVFIFLVRRSGESTVLYLIFSVNILAVLADTTWFFQGIERFDKIAIRNIIFQILSILYIFVFVRGRGDEAKYVVGITAFVLMSNLSLWVELPKYIRRSSDLHPFRNIKPAAALFLPSIAIQIYGVLDKTMLGVIVGDAFENGFYEQAMKVPRGLLVVVNALGTVVVPKIAAAFAEKDTAQVKTLLYGVYRAVWMLAVPFCLGLILVSDYFVPWFYGPGYDKVALLLKVAAPIILLIGINSTTALEYLVPTRRENLFSRALLIGACTNFCLNMICIRLWASVGAAAASVVAELVINVVEFKYMRGELSVRRVLAEGRNYFLSGAVMAAVLIGVRLRSRAVFGCIPGTIPRTAVFVLTGMAVYTLCLVILKDELVLSVLKRVRSKND